MVPMSNIFPTVPLFPLFPCLYTGGGNRGKGTAVSCNSRLLHFSGIAGKGKPIDHGIATPLAGAKATSLAQLRKGGTQDD